MIGKSLRTINPRHEFNINVVAIKKMIPQITPQGDRLLEESLNDVPDPDLILSETDNLLIIGTDKDVEKFASHP